MTRTQKRFATLALVLVAGLALAANIDNAKRYLKGGIDVWNDIAGKDTTSTFAITSDTTAATMTSSVAAITLAPTATPGANDLVLEVNDAAGNSLFSVDNEGDVVFAGTLACGVGAITGDISLTGNDLTATGTGQTFNVVSAAVDGTTSGTVGAITLKASANITGTDLLVDMQDSSGNHAFTVTEGGDAVALGRMSSGAGVTIADSGDGNPATATLNPATNVVLLTCSDTDGCTVTMGETGAVSGTLVTIVNMSANAAAFADTAGISETTGAVSLGQYDSLQLVYATDRWVEVATSNN